MGISAWNRLIQLQFVTFKIFTYKISKQKQYKKYTHQFKKKKIGLLIFYIEFQFEIYLDFLSALPINIYTELTHLAQKFRLDGTRGATFNSN